MRGVRGSIPTRELTVHERDLAAALGRGERITDIATRLNITAGSVSNSARRACEKLDLYANRQLAEYARKQGWCA